MDNVTTTENKQPASFANEQMFASENNLFSRRNILVALMVGIMLLVIPVGIKLLGEQTKLKSKASSSPITFTEGQNLECDESGECTTTSDTIELEFNPPQ